VFCLGFQVEHHEHKEFNSFESSEELLIPVPDHLSTHQTLFPSPLTPITPLPHPLVDQSSSLFKFPSPTSPITPLPLPLILPTSLNPFLSITQILTPNTQSFMATTTTTMPTHSHLTTPKFDPFQPCKLRHYFDKLDMLFTMCSIINSDQTKRHACCYLNIDLAELWESVPEFATGVSFNNFRTAIHKLYSGSENNCKWSISDMDKLVSIFDASNLGMYYRLFYNITQFLHMKNRILEAEQSGAFVRGFQPGLWMQIECHLELKLPDHYPNNPYNLKEIHEAMKFVLAGSSTSHPTAHQHSITTSSQAVPSTSESHTHIKSEDLTMIFK
jgi:hypothetical protein